MKPINIIKCFSILYFAVLSLALIGCEEKEDLKWVDLRYRVEDSYLLTATNPEVIKFQVKSTDTWEILGSQSWYKISPDKGEAGDTYDVTITSEENTNLDDRTDTISIKSDYWIGKTFTVTQKGIAYLNYENVSIIPQLGGNMTFDILSNQKWTAKVTDGDVWLSIVEGTPGELNGSLTVLATPNSGEMRTGRGTIYDRHSQPVQIVECVQDGVMLNPQVPENGLWYQLYEQAQKLVIPVESNAAWTIKKENEADEDWYTFEKTSFDGSDNIVVNLTENVTSKVRTGVIVISTVADEGATPLVKYVKFKQANPLIPEVKEVNATISGDYYGPGGLMPGRYNFYLAPLGSTNMNLFFIWSGSNPYAELRYHIVNKKTQLSTTPWCSNVFNESASCIHDVDTSIDNVLSFNIEKYIDENDPSKVWIYTEWILNDKVIAKAISDGKNDVNGTDDTWKVPFDQISAGGNFLLRATGGNLTLKKYEYIAPLDWGE